MSDHRAPKETASPARRALRRLANRLSRHAQLEESRGVRTGRTGHRSVIACGGLALVALVYATTMTLRPGRPAATDPSRPTSTIVPTTDVAPEPAWESSTGVALVTSSPSTAPGAHPSEHCLPITDESAARCYQRAARNAPRTERVLRNLIIAYRLVGDWDSTSKLAATYCRRHPRSPFLSGIRPLVFGPDTRFRPVIPAGLTPTIWERLADEVGGEVVEKLPLTSAR